MLKKKRDIFFQWDKARMERVLKRAVLGVIIIMLLKENKYISPRQGF